MTEQWTSRDTDILEALALKVRVLTDKQLAAGWWGDEQAVDAVHAAMQPLCQLGLVECLEVLAHPIIPISPPAFSWKDGDPEPGDKIRLLAEQFQSRWTPTEVSFTVYVATKAGANLIGSHIPERPKNAQWTHDIHVGEIYTAMKRTNTPDQMRKVIGEGAVPKLGFEIDGMKDPDLFEVDEHGQAVMVIEFAGSYDEKHLRQLHAHCSKDAFSKFYKRFPNRKYRLYPNPKGTPYCLI